MKRASFSCTILLPFLHKMLLIRVFPRADFTHSHKPHKVVKFSQKQADKQKPPFIVYVQNRFLIDMYTFVQW